MTGGHRSAKNVGGRRVGYQAGLKHEYRSKRFQRSSPFCIWGQNAASLMHVGLIFGLLITAGCYNRIPLVIDGVERRLADHSRRSPHENIRPGLPTDIELGGIDCESGGCLCQGEPVWYDLVPVSGRQRVALAARLERLDNSPLFGRYTLTTALEDVEQIRYRFTRSLFLPTPDSMMKTIAWPEAWTRKLGQLPSRIWLEAGVRTDRDGLPLEETFSTALPIAALVGDDLFQVVIRPRRLPNVACMLAVHYGAPVFAFNRTSHARSDSVSRAYLDTLRVIFGEPPLQATAVVDAGTPPGEIWLRREFERSLVLGSPYFELSTYIIKWWQNTSWLSTFSRPPDVETIVLSLQVSQSLTRAVGINAIYSEPTIEQVARFRDRVVSAVAQAQKAVCDQFHGTMGVPLPAFVGDTHPTGIMCSIEGPL